MPRISHRVTIFFSGLLLPAWARARVWVCDTVYIALLLTFIGGPINPDLETKHNCEEWRSEECSHERRDRDNGDIYEASLSLSPETVKLGLGAKLSGGVATHTVERWTRLIWPPTPWPWGLWWQTVLRVMMAPVCLVTSLQCLRGDPVLIIIPSDQTPHNERAGPARHQSMTDNYIFILSSSHHQEKHISWSPCDLNTV